MRISIYNLHNMCENNTLFLSRAWRYFQLNGHTVTDAWEEVDLVFVGGCAVTDLMRSRCEQAILKSMQQLPQARFVIFGCLAAFPEGFRSIAGRDADRLHIIPYHASRKLDELIQARIPFDTVSVSQLRGHVPYQPRIGPNDFYVLIAQGCINDCSYCNIKKAKGSVRSRPEEAIEAEVRNLHRIGVRTVTLLADDCGSYGLDRDSDLPKLIGRLIRVAPDLRYKLYTVFPSLFLRYTGQLEPLFAERRVPYVCLPAQSGSPRVLELMNRHYDPDDLAEAITRLRVLDSQVFVYSHFIFNFPTETWDEFEQSIAFARHFDHCVFIGYGENNSTRAATLVPKCGNRTLQAKTRRLEELVGRGELAAFVVSSP
ncbi:MAG: radical SAM protein [Syntrophobacterales bacterium]|nr:MAG: radical SAM protein [Syntrophobacterales bacterium]